MADEPETPPSPEAPEPAAPLAPASRVGEGEEEVGKTDEMGSPVGGLAGTSR